MTQKRNIPPAVVLGEAVRDPGFDIDTCLFGDSLEECFVDFEQAPALDFLARQGTIVYVAGALSPEDKKTIGDLIRTHPASVVDEAFQILEDQLGRAITGPEDFEDYSVEAAEKLDLDIDERICLMDIEEEGEIRFHAPGRRSQVHVIRWCADGVIELDGVILRRTAIWGYGAVKSGMLGDRVLEPAEVLGFIASRILTHGVEGMLGYGRAFGPGKEDKTNATLTPRSREFRSKAVVGVISANLKEVRKGKHTLVKEVFRALIAKDPLTPRFLHQQAIEGYEGQLALETFRGTQEGDVITLPCKSTKHARVDSGAYVLYTEDGSGMITVPAIIGMFDISDDGSIYAPLELLDNVRGYLKESVQATVDYNQLSPELTAKYFDSEMLVAEGDRIDVGQTMFTIGGIPHRWKSKADYGVVESITEVIQPDYVQLVVTIQAYFERELKVRGFGKGLVCPSEAAKVSSFVTSVYGVEDMTPRMIIGAPGVIKDSGAANEYMSNKQTVSATVSYVCCERDYLRLKEKHIPVHQAGGTWVREYKQVSMVFEDTTNTISITDEEAIACDIRVAIEASPVAQSVGNSGMTIPQMSWLSSLPSGNEWLKKWVLPRIQERIDILSYLHQVREAREEENEDDCF